MSPDGSMTMPVPMRSSPSMRVEGWAAGTSVWMCTTDVRSRLTSSTEASMGQSPTLARRAGRGQRLREYQRADDQLLRVVSAAAGIHGDGRRVAHLGEDHPARAGPLEGGPVDHRQGEDPTLRPAEGRHALRNDERLRLEILERSDRIIE